MEMLLDFSPKLSIIGLFLSAFKIILTGIDVQKYSHFLLKIEHSPYCFPLPSKIDWNTRERKAEARSYLYLTDDSKTFWPVHKDFLVCDGSQ